MPSSINENLPAQDAPLSSSVIRNLAAAAKAEIEALQEKAQEHDAITISVGVFGAIGNGIADDTAAIQNAINSGAGVKIYFPPGTYKISSQIVISNDFVHLLGNGATIRRVAAESIVITGNYCTISGLSFDGNKAGFPFPAYLRSSILVIEGVGNKIEGCTLKNGNSHGVLLKNNAQKNGVFHCHVSLCDEIGIAHNKATKSVIQGNFIASCGFEGITLDNAAHECIVSNNNLYANCVNGGVGGIGIDASDFCIISKNIVANTLNSLPGLAFQNNLGPCKCTIVSENAFKLNTGFGVHLKNGSGGATTKTVVNANVFFGNTLGSIKIDAFCADNQIKANFLDTFLVSEASSTNSNDPGLVYALLKNTVTRTAVTGDNTSYTVPFNTLSQHRNAGTAVNLSTGVFTAPLSGLYQFSAALRVDGGALQDFSIISVVTPTQTFAGGCNSTDMGVQELTVSGSCILLKFEQVRVDVRVGGSTKTVNVSSEPNHNFFSICLIN